MYRKRAGATAVLLFLAICGTIGFTYDLIAHDDSLPRQPDTVIGIASDGMAKSRGNYVTWEVAPKDKNNSSYETVLRQGWTIKGAQNPTAAYELALLSPIKKTDLSCDDTDAVTVSDITFGDLGNELTDALARAQVALNQHTSYSGEGTSRSDLLTMKDALRKRTGVLLTYKTSGGSPQPDGSFNISGSIKCIVPSLGVFGFTDSSRIPVRDFSAVATTPPVGSSIPYSEVSGATSDTISQLNVYLNGRATPKRTSTDYATKNDGSFRWSLSGDPVSTTTNRRVVQTEPAITATFYDQSNGWHRDLILVALGALLGVLGGAVSQLIIGNDY